MVIAGRRGRLAHIQESLHGFRAGADLVLAPGLGHGRVYVAVFAGIEERVVVGGAADAPAHVAEGHIGKRLVRLVSGQCGGKSQRGDVEAILPRVASLGLIVAREAVAQLQHRCRIDRVIVPNQEVPPVGNVLRVVQIPIVVEGVHSRGKQPVK